MNQQRLICLGRNKDIIRYNNFGRTLVGLCCIYDIHIVNGRCSGDSDGNYTCIANEGHSVEDYHLTLSELFPFISYFNIEMRDESDLLSHLQCEVIPDPIATDPEPPRISIDKLNWRNSSKDMFIETFNDNLIECRNDILHTIDGNINEAVLYIVNLYQTSAKSCRMVVSDRNPAVTSQPEWW